MENQIVKIDAPELSAIEKSKAEQIKKTFEPMAEMLTTFESAFSEIIEDAQSNITHDICERAKRLRIDIGKVRIETGKLKDKQKEYIKLEDRAIMGVHNILVWAVKEKEDKLKEIENHFEIQEKKRLEELQSSRVAELSEYVDDAHERNLSIMDDDVWSAYLSTKKKEYNDRIEAEKKAEAERIEREKKEAAEREQIRIENERLKKEAAERAEREAKEREHREKIEAERIAKEETEQKKREEEAKKEREAHEAKLRSEREQREKIESELRAKEEAEKRAKEEEIARIESELSKGDAAKVKDLISDLNSIKSKYSFKSSKNKKMFIGVNELIDKVVEYISK